MYLDFITVLFVSFVNASIVYSRRRLGHCPCSSRKASIPLDIQEAMPNIRVSCRMLCSFKTWSELIIMHVRRVKRQFPLDMPKAMPKLALCCIPRIVLSRV